MDGGVQLRRRYTDTPDGQLHLTECGPEEARALVLMHWTPLNGRQFEWELPVLAGLGWRAIAVDCMGFGRSDRRPDDAPWPIERHAAAISAALQSVGVRAPVVSGGHFSTSVAVALSFDPDLAVAAVAVDGGALMPPEAVQAILAKAKSVGGPGLRADGGHRSFLFDQAVNTYQVFAPGWELTEATLPLVYRFMEAMLLTGMPADMGSTVPYDIAAALGKVTVPLLNLSSETEPLHPSFQPMLEAARAGGREPDAHIFPGDHPLHFPERAGEYARTLDAFARRHGIAP